MQRLILLLMLLTSVTLFGQGIPYNQEFLVSTNTEQHYGNPIIEPLQNGRFVICWMCHDGTIITRYDIYAQIFQNNGTPVCEKFRVNVYTENDQRDPVIKFLKDGGFVISWKSMGRDDNYFNMYFRQFDANGSPVSGENLFHKEVSHGFSSDNVSSVIESLPDGGFVICWFGKLPNIWRWGIWAQRYHADGSKNGEVIDVDTYPSRNTRDVIIKSLTDDGFVICWNDIKLDDNSWDIFAQKFRSDGSKVGDEIRANTYVKGDQKSQDITSLSDGGFVICWQSGVRDGHEWDIYAQQFGNDASKVGNEFRVNTLTSGLQISPSIEELTDGSYLICWLKDGYWDSPNWGIYKQRFYADGRRYGEEKCVSTIENSYYEKPKIAILENGSYVITWLHSLNNSYYSSIIQLYNKDGYKIGKEFSIDNVVLFSLKKFDIVSINKDGFIICWSEYGQPGTKRGIYAKYYLSEPIIHQLQGYQLISPGNDETQNTLNPTFFWQQPSNIRVCYPWEIEYDLYLSTDEEFSNPIIYTGLQDSSYTLPQADTLSKGHTYFWKVLAKNIEGDSLWSSNTNAFFISYNAFPTKVEEDQSLPAGYVLEQNYPNPFNPVTTVRYTLPQAGDVELALYDVTGRRVKTLVQGVQSMGTHTAQIDGNDLASGVYLYTLKSGSFVQSKKMVLIK